MVRIMNLMHHNKKYYISICLLAKNENDYINEWLKWHIDLGIEHFYIYDNDSNMPLINSIDKNYLSYCTIIDFPSPRKHIQQECYKHCLDNYKQECEWMAFIDGDEFIRLKNSIDTIQNFLKNYEAYDGLYIKWTVYNANGHLKKENKPLRKRFTQTVEFNIKNRKNNANGKTIIHSDNIIKMSAHCPTVCSKYNVVDEDFNKLYSPYNAQVPYDKITIDHYYTKSLEEWEERISYGSCDPHCKRLYEDFYLFNPELERRTNK